jgi:hypothetical protein
MSKVQLREEKIFILKEYYDQVKGICYLKVLTTTGCESIKISTKRDKQKFDFFLKPNYLLDVELVKTVKNWILKNITSYQVLLEPRKYSDYELLAQMQKLIDSNVKEGQQISILPFLVQEFQKDDIKEDISKINLKKIEYTLLSLQGFAITNHNDMTNLNDLNKSIQNSKYENQL